MNALLDFSHYTPHGFCLAWQPGLVWLEAASDLAIAAAYYSIPAALLVFLGRRKDLAFKPVFGLFAAFILACGTTHVIGAVTLWLPIYWVDDILKLVTAGLSVATAIVLWPLLPKALALPSPVALRESEERARQLYLRAPAAMQSTDAAGVLTEVSDRWLELTGYARAAVIGRNICAFYDPESAAACALAFEAARQGADMPGAERRLVRADGSIRDVEAAFTITRDGSGQLLSVMAALSDVTPRKAAEAALQASAERLHHAQKLEAIGQLTGGIAHDFNNSLTTILGSLEMLQDRVGLDDRGKRMARNATESARRAARLTSQLLSFSRRARLAPAVALPGQIVDGMRDMLAQALGGRIKLTIVEAPEPWPLLADHDQIVSALVNLILNARDAIEGEGEVTIELSNRTLSAVEAETIGPDPVPPGDYAVIAVADTGTGMTDAVQKRAFEPFFTTKPLGAGTGLGLSQIYGFVRQSGGTVTIDSLNGQGTKISMLMPRAEEEWGEGDPPPTPPVSDLSVAVANGYLK